MQYAGAVTLEIVGIFFTIIVGALLHFAYQYSGNNRIVGLFTPVNESTWEHLKLLFFPMLLYSIMEYFAFGRDVSNYIGAKSIGIVIGMILIVVLFYAYTGILKRNALLADIAIFMISVVAAYIIGWQIMINGCPIPNYSIILIIMFIIFFFVFTYYPPHNILFLDPVSKGYGGVSVKSKA